MMPIKFRLAISGRSLLIWGIAVVSGVMAAMAARQHLDQKIRQLEAAAAVPTVSRIVAAFDLPAGTRIDAMDRVVWRGEEFEVDGEVADYTSGPWRNPVAGVVINLKRAEG